MKKNLNKMGKAAGALVAAAFLAATLAGCGIGTGQRDGTVNDSGVEVEYAPAPDEGVTYAASAAEIAAGEELGYAFDGAVVKLTATNRTNETKTLSFESAAVEASQGGEALMHVPGVFIAALQEQGEVTLEPGASAEGFVCFKLIDVSTPLDVTIGEGEAATTVTLELG